MKYVGMQLFILLCGHVDFFKILNFRTLSVKYLTVFLFCFKE